MSTLRDSSRKQWAPHNEAATECINAGSLQRIADATEAMAKNYVSMQAELDRYKRWYEQEQRTTQRLYRQISALRGVITKLRNKLARATPQDGKEGGR